MRCIDLTSRRVHRKADEGGMPGRMSIEENAARRRMAGEIGGEFLAQDTSTQC
jgi:hypothetical protein